MTEAIWQRSSFSEASGNNCVEVAAMGAPGVALRESESPTAVLMTHPAALQALIRDLKAGTSQP
ncbi:DUF397 domain-containing protein [Streptomyces sp. NPDC029674]|uniref:DUF397 domain-containing protein n=1 Tax=Streptomyces sp. NPDC029674 TaxID=3365297 RepID=UPI00384E3336